MKMESGEGSPSPPAPHAAEHLSHVYRSRGWTQPLDCEIVSTNAVETAGKLCASPLYPVVNECVPAVSGGELSAALPFTSVAADTARLPSSSRTVPVGTVPELFETATLNVCGTHELAVLATGDMITVGW